MTDLARTAAPGNRELARPADVIVPAVTRLDIYAGGATVDDERVDPLASISAGYKDAKGVPHAVRPGDLQTIYVNDPEGRAPFLSSIVEASVEARRTARENNQVLPPMRLTVTAAYDSVGETLRQYIARRSSGGLQVFGDEHQLTEKITRQVQKGDRTVTELLRQDVWLAGTPQYLALLPTCKVESWFYWMLAEWEQDGDDLRPVTCYYDGFAPYALRFTSRNSARSLQQSLQAIARQFAGHIKGIPLELEVTFPEVARPDGTRTVIPKWTLVMRHPRGIRMTPRWIGGVASLALAEARDAALLALPDPTHLDTEPLDFADVTDQDAELLARGGRCDIRAWEARWFAKAAGTPWASDEARAAFLDAHTDGRTDSLADFLANANDAEALDLLGALVAAITRLQDAERRERNGPTTVTAVQAAQYHALYPDDDPPIVARPAIVLGPAPAPDPPDVPDAPEPPDVPDAPDPPDPPVPTVDPEEIEREELLAALAELSVEARTLNIAVRTVPETADTASVRGYVAKVRGAIAAKRGPAAVAAGG